MSSDYGWSVIIDSTSMRQDTFILLDNVLRYIENCIIDKCIKQRIISPEIVLA